MSYPLDLICELLEVFRSGSNYWKKSPVNKLQAKKQAIRQRIQDSYFQAKGLYVSPRIVVELTRRNCTISRTTVARHMKEMNFQSKHRR